MGLRVLILASIVTGLSVSGAEAKRGFSFKGFGGSAKAAPAPAAIPKPALAPTVAKPAPAAPAAPVTTAAPSAPAPAAVAPPAPAAAAAAPVSQSRSLIIISGGPRRANNETEEQRRQRETLPVTDQATRDTRSPEAVVQPAAYRTDGVAAAPKGFKTLN